MIKFRLLLSVALLALISMKASAQSETFKPFKVDLAFGYAKPAGSGSSGGVIVALEPKYSISDNLTLGLRLEAAAMARALVIDGVSADTEVKTSSAYLLTADYFFNTNKFRPFVGLGAGAFSLAGISIDASEFGIEDGSLSATETKFGVTPRLGFEFGHFRLAAEYNIIGKTEEVKNSYLGIKAGFFFGGGRR